MSPYNVGGVRVGGEPYFAFYADWDRNWIVPAGQEVSRSVSRVLGGRRIAHRAPRHVRPAT